MSRNGFAHDLALGPIADIARCPRAEIRKFTNAADQAAATASPGVASDPSSGVAAVAGRRRAETCRSDRAVIEARVGIDRRAPTALLIRRHTPLPNFERCPGWETEIPRYRAVHSVRPSPNPRHRTETPLSSISDSSVWQFAERDVAALETVETTAWPHSSFRPLNASAEAVLACLNSATKSRLPISPWRSGGLYLSDGLSGTIPQIKSRAVA